MIGFKQIEFFDHMRSGFVTVRRRETSATARVESCGALWNSLTTNSSTVADGVQIGACCRLVCGAPVDGGSMEPDAPLIDSVYLQLRNLRRRQIPHPRFLQTPQIQPVHAAVPQLDQLARRKTIPH